MDNQKTANDIMMAIQAKRGGQVQQHRQPIQDADLHQAVKTLEQIPDIADLVQRQDFIQAMSANSPYMIKKSLIDVPQDYIEQVAGQYGKAQQALQANPEGFGAFTRSMNDPRLLEMLRQTQREKMLRPDVDESYSSDMQANLAALNKLRQK